MSAQRTTIPHAIVDCIAHAREPGLQEMRSVAQHIWRDIRGSSPFGLPTSAKARRLSVRAAHAALAGCE